jgi:hypothetical protein
VSYPYKKYLTQEYFINNPSWDIEDSFWKAQHIDRILKSTSINPSSICEIGCGAGVILASLRDLYPNSDFTGYDIAPDAQRFWGKHIDRKIKFYLEDFFNHNNKIFDVIAVIDVIEHIADPYLFLSKLHNSAKYYIFHIPLDLCMFNLVRKNALINLRKKVGHLHYFTKEIALEIFRESEYKLILWQYSGLSFTAPRRTWKTKLASIPRKIIGHLNKDFGVKVLGGESLWVMLVD